jgi:hypothetical protein
MTQITTVEAAGSPHRRTPSVPSFTSIDWRSGAAIFAVMLVLRVIYAFHFRFDTDEPQHLHVVWGWAHGHLQYRDIFDNHGPIFHLLCVPLFRLLGERPDILIPMRLAMIPLFGISLWCIYQIGTALASRQVGIWAAILCGFYPEFFLTSSEFRTDNLWTVLWLLALVTAVRMPFTAKRAFIVGLLLGAAFAVTVKTGLMIGSLGLTAAVITGARWFGGKKPDWKFIGTRACAGAAGLMVVPCLVMSFFAAHRALKEFIYCNVSHNLVPRAQNWQQIDAHFLWFPIFAVIVLSVLRFIKLATRDEIVTRRWYLVFTAGFYFSALKTFFPTLSRQDDLPVIPLASLVIVLCCFLLHRHLTSRPRLQSVMAHGLFPVFLAAEIITLVVTVPFSKNNTQRDIAMVADVLRATEPNDFVMDATGETIFRMRPFYYALEAFTKVRMERGLIQDEIADRLIATRTAVVRLDGLTSAAQAFVRHNYVKTGNDLYMPGQSLQQWNGPIPGSVSFEIAIPGRYEVVSNGDKEAVGKLDGTPLNGPRMLESGPHTFAREDKQTGTLFVFWDEALRRGFSPYKKH